MSTPVYVCGTGGWGGPLPGDPDNNVILSATPAFGGIDVSWTYPVLNPFAVSHTLVYRTLTPTFINSIERQIVAGNFFYDKIDNGLTYYYWIKLVSINGTVGDVIGPASATARPLIEDLIEQLTGHIDAGVLATSLKGTLDNISLVNADLATEIFDRQTGETSLAQALEDVQAGVAQANTFITTEIASRISANSAIAEQINLVATTLGDSIAAVVTDSTAWIETVGGVTTSHAKYSAKVTADGLIGGFGIYNDSTTVEAGFDVDTFWVGRTNANKRKPFIIDGATGETFIDSAVIRDLVFTKLRDESGSVMVIPDPVTGLSKLKAEYIEATEIVIKDGSGTTVLASGTGVFSGALSAATGTFSGSLSGATGEFAGTLRAGVVDLSSAVGVSIEQAVAGSYSVVVPAGYLHPRLRYRVVGAGGGGGGAAVWGAHNGGGGGGGGQVLTGTTAVGVLTAGQTIYYTVGASGSSGAYGGASGTAGGDGGNTSVASIVTAIGGHGGGAGDQSWTLGAGGAAGGSGGSAGGVGTDYSWLVTGGVGGASFGPGGAGASHLVNPIAGNRGGGGGGGCGYSTTGASENSGAIGGAGYVLLEIFDDNAVILQNSFNSLLLALDQQSIRTYPI